jgi:hypothetical protein
MLRKQLEKIITFIFRWGDEGWRKVSEKFEVAMAVPYTLVRKEIINSI